MYVTTDRIINNTRKRVPSALPTSCSPGSVGLRRVSSRLMRFVKSFLHARYENRKEREGIKLYR